MDKFLTLISNVSKVKDPAVKNRLDIPKDNLYSIRRYKNLFAKILDKSTILTGSLPFQS
jgi:hypothetical protein